MRIAEIDNFMAESISAVQLIVEDTKKSTLDPTEFLTASSPETCQFCNYKSICWEPASSGRTHLNFLLTEYGILENNS
jgi:hypothetical protein